ncbi:hypothetical protein [Hymenobacter wooponensis]|uniref:Uncharacterized protein n=1 Tax=Hymenobacter wooponensis TaxID=1525360 RepID=A0A4Z0MHL3_9BACT|nr:hypothetical protein [Hymenobacter wooponensis]TGD79006.1 hypothetical protein EU557_18720 [Hymenobacter wooponensis]
MIAGKEWSFGLSTQVEPAEIVLNTGEVRITAHGLFTTPLSFHNLIGKHAYSYLQIVVDKHNHFFLYFRFDWPADQYYGPYQVMLNRRETQFFTDLQLTNFTWYAYGTGQLSIRCVPGIVGGVFYDLSGISAENGQALTSLIKKLKEPQSQCQEWF